MEKSDKLNLMKMVKYMRKNDRIIKMDELAEHLETTERAVRRYKQLLVEGGYDLVTHFGKDGGYYLRCDRITDEEWTRIEDSLNHSPILLKKLKDAYFNYLY